MSNAIPEDLIVEQFHSLFEGRPGEIFIEDRPGSPPRCHHLGPEETIEGYIRGHLFDGHPIGIYPLKNGDECRWICSDFDDENAEEYAWRLSRAWEWHGVQAWVETSRSKGYHVWVFIEDWVSGTAARGAGLWIHEVAQVPALEVNPKQELTSPDVVGNCVRLPYAHGRDPGRQIFWPEPGKMWGGHAVFDQLELILDTRADPDTIRRLGALWHTKPVTPPETTDSRPIDRERVGGARKEYLHIREVFRGNIDITVGERDNVFFTLANYMKALEDISLPQALDIAQEIWAEQCEDRKTYPLRLVQEKVRRAYGQSS